MFTSTIEELLGNEMAESNEIIISKIKSVMNLKAAMQFFKCK